jgi:hypothetical protein
MKLTMLPLTETSLPVKLPSANLLKGTHAAGNWTMRLFGTVIVYPFTDIFPPEL